MFKYFTQPKIEKLLEQEHYQAQREVVGQQERVHRLKVTLSQAEAALVCYEERQEDLEAQLRRIKRLAEGAKPKAHDAQIPTTPGPWTLGGADKTPAMGMDH